MKIKMWELLLIILVVVIIPVVLINMSFNRKNQNESEEIILVTDMIGKTAENKTLKLTDSDGAIFYLPKGFKVSEEIEEPKVSSGIVIVDDTGDKQTNGSEFVWVPVENTTYESFKEKFVSINGYLYGSLDLNFDKYKSGSGETEEYKKMCASIFKYGGFYIARYEAGVSDKMLNKLTKADYIENEEIVNDTTEKFGKGNYKPVSKSGATIWTNIQWGGTFNEKASDGLAGNDEANGAVKVSRSMYKNSKTTVRSNLCYGNQWDAVMGFLDSNYFEGKCTPESVILKSQVQSNYEITLEKSGFYNEENTKNILDLCGNVFEWTMEGCQDKQRVIRGSGFSSLDDKYSMSSRAEFYPSDYYNDLGFRVALYINE